MLLDSFSCLDDLSWGVFTMVTIMRQYDPTEVNESVNNGFKMLQRNLPLWIHEGCRGSVNNNVKLMNVKKNSGLNIQNVKLAIIIAAVHILVLYSLTLYL